MTRVDPAPGKISVPAEIRTKRLVLQRQTNRNGFGVNASRPLSQVIFEAVDGDRARLREYLGWVDLAQTIGDQEAYLTLCEEEWEKFEGFKFGIYLPTGELIGDCGLHTVSKSNRRAELGYWILGEFENQGLMTEAIDGLSRACFSAGFHRLEIRCNEANEKSYRVAERLGFRLEGTLREDCIEYDVWGNTRIYGALASDDRAAGDRR